MTQCVGSGSSGIGVVVNGRTDWLDAFEGAVAAQTDGLGLDVKVFERDEGSCADCGVLLYLVGEDGIRTNVDDGALQHALKDGAHVLPVLEEAVAAEFLPPPLRAVNAFLCEPQGNVWPVVLADEALSRLWLSRLDRRVFLSYKRADAAAAADQLHTRFEKRGFDTFFDECSIPHGEDFQRDLRYRLNDTDLVVLLASPNFADSRWVMEEVEFAKSSQIGLVAVVWPNVAPNGSARAVVERVPLKDRTALAAGDVLADGVLSEAAVERVHAAACRARVGSLVRRMRALVPLAEAELAAGGSMRPASRLGDFHVDNAHGRSLVRVLPYRPGLEDVFAAWEEARDGTPPPREVVCFYEENDPAARGVSAMRWAIDGAPNAPQERRVRGYAGRVR